jgi:large subunit ribosomal protein L32
MIAPKKKISKAKGASRHSTWLSINMKKLANRAQVHRCNNCGTEKLMHRVCPHCGWYKGVQVMTIKTKKQEVLEA